MNHQELVFNLIPPSVLVSIAFSVVCTIGSLAMHALRQKFKDDNFAALLDQVDKLATIVVLEIEQTVVQPAKLQAESGKLTVETAAMVKAQAVRRFIALLGDKQSALRKAFGNVTTTAETLIEAKVREMRLIQNGRKVK